MACFGDFPQRHDRVFVVVALDRDLRARRDHTRAVAGQQDQIEAVLNLVDAIFNGDSGHFARFLGLSGVPQRDVVRNMALRYRPRPPSASPIFACDFRPMAVRETATRRDI